MKKFLSIIAFLICAAVVLALGYLWTNRVQIVSTQLSNAIGLSVLLDDVSVSYNSVTLYNLRVYNPPGASIITALTAKQLTVKMSPLELFKQHIRLDTVTVKDMELGLELFSADVRNSSWTRMIKSFGRKDTTPVAPTTAAERTWVIQDFVATNVRVRAKSRLVSDNSLNLPTISKIELHNIGSTSPLTFKQALAVIMQRFLDEMQEPSVLQDLYDKVKSASDKVIQKVLKKS